MIRVNEMDGFVLALIIAVIIVLLAILISSIKIVQPYEQGIYLRFGKFIKVLDPGMNMVTPFISEVPKVDLRTQTFNLPNDEILTKDGSPIIIKGTVQIRVTDAKKAYFETPDYIRATIKLSQNILESTINSMELEEIINEKEKLRGRLKYALDRDTNEWGIRIESVDIENIEISSTVSVTIKSTK